MNSSKLSLHKIALKTILALHLREGDFSL